MELNEKILAGIVLGNRNSGTSVIAIRDEVEQLITLKLFATNGNESEAIEREILQVSPSVTTIYAPLSLPEVYCRKLEEQGLEEGNYLYRKCDVELGGNSPMLTGDLTSRAIALKDKLLQLGGIQLWETNPLKLAEFLDLEEAGYMKSEKCIPDVLKKLKAILEFPVTGESIVSWHQVDALLTLISAIRIKNKDCRIYGEEEEGLIYV